MPTMISEVYDVVKSAGAEDEKSFASASIADYQRDIAELKSHVEPIKWIFGFNPAFAVTIVMLIVRLPAATAT